MNLLLRRWWPLLLTAGALGCRPADPAPPTFTAQAAAVPTPPTSCPPPLLVSDGNVYSCLNQAEQRATMNRQGYFEIGLDLGISETGRVTSAVAFGDGSTSVQRCLERRALLMEFHLIVPCPGGTRMKQHLAVGNAGHEAQ